MNESPAIRAASVRDIQLALRRRTTFNALDGERVLPASTSTGRCGWPSPSTGPASRTTPGTGRRPYGLLVWWD